MISALYLETFLTVISISRRLRGLKVGSCVAPQTTVNALTATKQEPMEALRTIAVFIEASETERPTDEMAAAMLASKPTRPAPTAATCRTVFTAKDGLDNCFESLTISSRTRTTTGTSPEESSVGTVRRPLVAILRQM